MKNGDQTNLRGKDEKRVHDGIAAGGHEIHRCKDEVGQDDGGWRRRIGSRCRDEAGHGLTSR
jgi:hypothetical protein